MPTPSERRALIFLAALGALGVGVRAFRGGPASGGATASATRAALERQIGSVDSATSAGRARSAGGARRKREHADAEAPGPAPARQRARGADGAGAGSDAQRPADPLALYEARRLEVARQNEPAQARIDRDLHGTQRGAAPAAAAAPSAGRAVVRQGSGRPVDLDVAGAAEIEALPSVGPVLAARIVAERAARGPFGSLAGLQRVRGVGSALAARIGPFVTFSGIPAGAQSTVKFRAVRVRPNRP